VRYGWVARGPLLRRSTESLPENRRVAARHGFARFSLAEERASGELARDPRLAALEAVLFAAEEPLSTRRLAGILGVKEVGEAARLVARLQALYQQGESAFQVEELAGGYQLHSRPELHPWLARLRRGASEFRLSSAARETLAIVAYRQPIMRAEVEAIRGVKCDEVLRQLLEKGLLRIAGRDNSLGRPVVYATTKKFLQIFGLKRLEDLPQADQLRSPAKREEVENPPAEE
jgi:segregation and condensation protein B